MLKLCVRALDGDPRANGGRAGGRLEGYAARYVTRSILLALALLVAAAGCRREVGPAERYRAFAAAAREGNADAVWSMLSEDSRAALDERARALAAETPPGVVVPSGRQLVIGDHSARAPRPKAVVVLRESRDRALVSVEVEGEPAREVTLVREAGVWRVVVPFDN
jgi:hypothetical protein